MSSYFYEWCKVPTSRSGLMVVESDLQKIIASKNTSGFRSVFGYHPKHAAIIKRRRHSKGFKEFPCYADRVVIDIDTGEEGRDQAVVKVEAAGLAYKLYFSGGKGYHIIIPCKPMYSYHTPYSHMKFVEGLGIEPDISVYRHSSLISLEGRVHPKTKKKKAFLAEIEGNIAEVPIVQPPVFVNQLAEDHSYGMEAFERAAYLMLLQPREGDRYMSLWYCIKCFYDAGLPKEAAYQIAEMINDSWENPKESEELNRLLEDCYG